MQKNRPYFDYEKFDHPTLDEMEEEMNSTSKCLPSGPDEDHLDYDDDPCIDATTFNNRLVIEGPWEGPEHDFVNYCNEQYLNTLPQGDRVRAAQTTNVRSMPCHRHKGIEPSNTETRAAKRTNAPRGVFLMALKKGENTWRIQMWAAGKPGRQMTPYIRFQLWASGENGGYPIKNGPGCGFTLSISEAERVIKALQDALDKVQSHEFDPDDENNQIPQRSR